MSDAIRLLLVEDEPLVHLVLGEGLEDEGFSLVVKSDGGAALQELEANAAKFQAVLTDVRLGRGPSGWDIGRRARELVPTMPIIYMTADSAADWASNGVPGSILIPKPFIVGQVVAAVATLLNKDDV